MRYLVVMAALLLSPIAAFAQDSLEKIQNQLTVVRELEQQNLIPKEQSDALKKDLLQKASVVAGKELTQEELSNLTAQSRFYVFLNIALVFGAILLIFSIVGLIGYYLWPLIEVIPGVVYEILGYGFSALLMGLPYLMSTTVIGPFAFDPFWAIIPGGLLYLATGFLSYNLHFSTWSYSWVFSFATFAYAFAAYNLNHYFPEATTPYVLGFMSIMTLQAALGFSVLVIPGCVAMGWLEDDAVPRSTSASLLILFFYFISVLNPQPYFTVFQIGFLFMGAFVYYLGLLILSNSYYGRKKYGKSYWISQVLTIISGIAAFYIGTVFGVGILLGIGGTFFSIYFLEKYFEIPWKGVGWYWAALGLAAIIYFFVGFAKNNPQYFLWSY